MLPSLSKLLVLVVAGLALVVPTVTSQDTDGEQNPSNSAPDDTPPASSSPTLSLSLTTGSITIAIPTTVSGQNAEVTTVVPAVFNVTYTITPSASHVVDETEASASASASATPEPEPIVLNTRLDPAFGVLGAILILTGLPSAFWGHKNRWTSFFLIGFYTLSLVCIVLILKFGVLPAINPPSNTLRGMFVLSCTIAGFAGGAIAIFFWKAARYGIGAWGGFALALWIQCFSHGGLIRPIGFRWILYIGCGVAGFALCTIPKIHYHVLLVSTAFVGATSFMLGIDCFTTAGLKEFYIWNLGFPNMFPKFVDNHILFPVTQQMQIELGLTAAVALMGMAVQFRILKVLQRKLAEIAEEEKKRDEEAEMMASERFDEVKREQMDWERDHPTLPKHGRHTSSLSGRWKDREGASTPSTYLPHEEPARQRALSGLSDFKVAPTSEEELRRASRYMQNPGVLPTLDLGLGIQEDVPANFIASKRDGATGTTVFRKADIATVVSNELSKSKSELEDLRKKEELLAEIQNIRKSIDVLKSETPPSSGDPSRRPSLSSRRTLSVDANHALVSSTSLNFTHARPPRATDPLSGNRARSHSMEFSALTSRLQLGNFGASDPISRPTSVPLHDPDWDNYIQERKLLQPPAGVTPPIPTTPLPTRGPLPAAVQDALTKRKQRESTVLFGGGSGSERRSESEAGRSSVEDVPLAKMAKPRANLAMPPQLQSHNRLSSTSSHNGPPPPPPVTILPPRRTSVGIVLPAPLQQSPQPLVKTFEELNERHREKMRGMQAPLSKAEKDQIELAAAKQRWERNKAMEKEAMEKRQKEQCEKQKRRQSDVVDKLRKDGKRRQSRSMSGDRLGMSSRRLSTMKVEDWQRYQQGAVADSQSTPAVKALGNANNVGAAVTPSPQGIRRDSKSLTLGAPGVPFPEDQLRKSREPLSL